MTKATPKSEAIAGPLYDALVSALPICVGDNGNLSVADLADRLKMSQEGVYRWLRANEISKRGRKRLVDLANEGDNLVLRKDVKLTEDDLRPFT